MTVPVEQADRARKAPVPILRQVLAAVLAVIGATVAGGIWILQEVLAAHPFVAATSPTEFLFGSPNESAWEAVTLPVMLLLVVWSLLVLATMRSVRMWGASLANSREQVRQELQRSLEETEGKLAQASAALEFWKAQARDAGEKARVAESGRLELAGRMDQLTAREKTLAREQAALCQSKDRLEKHVEARTIELQRLQQRYGSILNGAGEGICSCDLEGRITFANPAAAAMMGWTPEEMLGQAGADLFANRAPRESGEGGDPGSLTPDGAVPVQFQRKDGSRFPVEVVRTPIEEAGRQVGTVLIFKDVTERTEADERFAAKVAELARSNSELEQFAFVASHDLQEPLRKIQAFGDRLRTRMGDELTPEASDYLSRMQSAAARMQGLINGLLMYSRVLTRAQPFTRVDLAVVVREVLEDLEVRIEKSRAQLEIGQLPVIEADALQIRQLLQNLIGNALKFQPVGQHPRVCVSARILHNPLLPEEPPGNTRWLSRQEVCELTVADNGIGFDEVYLKRLFVVFQRLHSREAYEGTGIGLAVCRKIVTRHGGLITARSQPGQGATFTVRLPVRQPARSGGHP
jgi:two-component system sensor kinase FixL